MAIVMGGKQFTADDLQLQAGDLATLMRDAVERSANLAAQLATWPDPDLLELGLQQDEINAIKGWFLGDVPTIEAALTGSTWIKQLLGTGI